VILLLFQLPKAVVESDREIATPTDSVASHIETHRQVPAELKSQIAQLRRFLSTAPSKEKNAIFADSLATLYRLASQFDSAAWYAEEAAAFFNTIDSWVKAGDAYYQAYTLAVDPARQTTFAAKTQEYYGKVLDAQPGNLDVKTRLAMTYIAPGTAMQGINILQEVLKANPKHEAALFNMGMLSIQAGQYGRAVERLRSLIAVNPEHLQGQLLLGVALMENGET